MTKNKNFPGLKWILHVLQNSERTMHQGKCRQWVFFCKDGPSILAFFTYSFIFNWLMIDLQYWFGFCHKSTWINNRYIWSLSPESPAHLLPIPTPLGYYRVRVWAPYVTQQIPIGCLFTYLSVYASMLLSAFISPSFSSSPHLSISLFALVHKSVSLCLHLHCCSANKFVSTILPDFMYLHWYTISVFLFLTYITLYNRL